jgi:hypothetical protein
MTHRLLAPHGVYWRARSSASTPPCRKAAKMRWAVTTWSGVVEGGGDEGDRDQEAAQQDDGGDQVAVTGRRSPALLVQPGQRQQVVHQRPIPAAWPWMQCSSRVSTGRIAGATCGMPGSGHQHGEGLAARTAQLGSSGVNSFFSAELGRCRLSSRQFSAARLGDALSTPRRETISSGNHTPRDARQAMF